MRSVLGRSQVSPQIMAFSALWHAPCGRAVRVVLCAPVRIMAQLWRGWVGVFKRGWLATLQKQEGVESAKRG